MNLLRVSTAGNVDDGKSTLIGRLLHDTGSLKEDHIKNLEGASQKMGFSSLHLALVTDGLKAEREQGITIDVAYRYFKTDNRKFILADTPGHEEFTRNMVTGTSNSDVALVLLDITRDESEQTKRHIMISHLLGAKEVVICVNKMDLVEFSQTAYQLACDKLAPLIKSMAPTKFRFIPICALTGDNIVTRSSKTAWYNGPSVLDFLDSFELSHEERNIPRFAVQMTLMPHDSKSAHGRRYAGMLYGGSLQVGDQVMIYPTMKNSIIKSIYRYQDKVSEAQAGEAVSLELTDEHHCSRGCWITKTEQTPLFAQKYQVKMCALQPRGLRPRTKYIARITTQEVECMVDRIESKVDFTSLSWQTSDNEVKINEIAQGTLKFAIPVMADNYQDCRQTGSMILIDPVDNQTVAAVMIEREV